MQFNPSRLAGALAAAGLTLAAGSASAVSIVGITTDNRITIFDSATPSMTSPYVTVTGVTAGARIVGIDTRPGDDAIYGVGTDNKLYTIDAITGVATVHTTLTGPAISSSLSYGIDFNPVADGAGGSSLRLVTSAGNNYAINVNTGVTSVIGNTASIIQTNFGGVAYTNSTNDPVPASTQLYYIDFFTDELFRADTAFNAPSIVKVGSLGFDTVGAYGFDITADGQAFASLTDSITGQGGLYSINLMTGAASLIGDFGVSSPLLAGMTVAAGLAPVPEPETYAMMLAGLGLVGWMALLRRRA
jgi:hypothetical protein